MSKNTSVTLGDHFESFIGTQLEHGRYGSTSEVIRAGLRLLEEHERKLSVLRRALDEGLESGDAGELDIGDIITKGKARIAQRSVKKAGNA